MSNLEHKGENTSYKNTKQTKKKVWKSTYGRLSRSNHQANLRYSGSDKTSYIWSLITQMYLRINSSQLNSFVNTR